ncbi:hypothetical protein ACFSTC_09795 [Nonomuraea ferruginea]
MDRYRRHTRSQRWRFHDRRHARHRCRCPRIRLPAGEPEPELPAGFVRRHGRLPLPRRAHVRGVGQARLPDVPGRVHRRMDGRGARRDRLRGERRGRPVLPRRRDRRILLRRRLALRAGQGAQARLPRPGPALRPRGPAARAGGAGADGAAHPRGRHRRTEVLSDERRHRSGDQLLEAHPAQRPRAGVPVPGEGARTRHAAHRDPQGRARPGRVRGCSTTWTT